MNYAQLPSGVIMPADLAKQTMAELLFGNSGTFRTASRNNKSTMGWVVSDGSADADSLNDLPTLRAQSRDLVRNEPLPAGAIAGVVSAVVGTGIVPQSRLDFKRLGITEEEATNWESLAEEIFEHEASKPTFDIEGKTNFYQAQDLVERSKLESGDVFVVRRFKERPGRMLGTCAQIIEADRVVTPPNKQTEAKIRAGIEVDADGFPLACHIAQKHPGETISLTEQDFTRIPFYDRDGRPVVLAVIPRKRPGQTRGIPYLAPVIEPLKQLSRYTEAEVTAAVISGMFAVFVKSASPVSPLTGQLIPGQVMPPTTAGSGLQKMQSGMIVDLAPGEEIQTADAGRPNTAFDPFVQAVLRQIGSALELPFEVLIRHFTSSYSAARAAIMDAWRFYNRERDFLVTSFCAPVWEWVITEAVARGFLKAPGFFEDPLIRAAWLSCEWIGSSIPQIDPLKEANAATKWNELGVLSLQDISASQGRDWDRTHRQIVKETKRRQADIPIQIDPNKQPQVQQPDPADPNDQ